MQQYCDGDADCQSRCRPQQLFRVLLPETDMPYLNVRLGGEPLDEESKRALLLRLTDLMETVMGKDRQVTVVSIDESPGRRWAAGGRALAAAARMAQVDVRITRGTNDADDKQRLIGHITAALMEIAGDSVGPIYVVIDEVPADAWGYDGLSQAERKRMTARAWPYY
jgi:4-oxalocrotonate tautomerase